MKNEIYPANEGWIKAKLTIVPGAELTKEQVIKFCTGRQAEDYEIPVFRHYKTVIRIIFRKKQSENENTVHSTT